MRRAHEGAVFERASAGKSFSTSRTRAMKGVAPGTGEPRASVEVPTPSRVATWTIVSTSSSYQPSPRWPFFAGNPSMLGQICVAVATNLFELVECALQIFVHLKKRSVPEFAAHWNRLKEKLGVRSNLVNRDEIFPNLLAAGEFVQELRCLAAARGELL